MKSRKKSSDWLLSVITSLSGAGVAWIGFYGYFHQNYWYTQFDERYGRFGTGTSLGFGFGGLLIIVLGLVILVKPSK